MPRKPEYQLTDIFEQAIPLILERGYRGCSMESLINFTGFNRRAFYLEFKNKHDFSVALLQFYIEHYLTPLQLHLQSDQPQTKAIITFFNAYQRHIETRGCLLVRLILELGNDNQQIQAIARRYYDQLQQSFIVCLEKAVLHKEIDHSINIEAFALKLSCFAQGFAVSNNIAQGESDVLLVIQTLFSE